MAIVYSGLAHSVIADKMGLSKQAFSHRLRKGKWTCDDLSALGSILGCRFVAYFEFPDGKTI
jgi:hypothetical protein